MSRSNPGETALANNQNRSENFATVNDIERSPDRQVLLNLVSEDTVLLKSFKGMESENRSFDSQSKVINDIGDIHEFYQERVLTDYK